MMYEVSFYELKYPKNCVPGMGYKKRMLARTWFSDLQRMSVGIERAVDKAAYRCHAYSKADAFAVRQINETMPIFCGSFP